MAIRLYINFINGKNVITILNSEDARTIHVWLTAHTHVIIHSCFKINYIYFS
jgi:hypothetical protein